MKKINSTLLILILPLMAYSQTGTIKGNVFWKYNNYVGDKADAGSKVLLFSLDNKNKMEATTDLQGNFIFNNIPDGDYFIAIVSNNVTMSKIDKVSKLIEYKNDLENLNLVDYTKADTNITQFKNYDRLYMIKKIENAKELTGNFNKDRKVLREEKRDLSDLENKRESLADTLLNEFKCKDILSFLEFVQPYRKIYFQKVNVKNGNSNPIVVDFGISYM